LLPDISVTQGIYFVSTVSKMETGGDLCNTDAAFKKLSSLKAECPYLLHESRPSPLLNSGEAWLAPWTGDRALTQVAAKAPLATVVPREGAVYWTSEMGIPKGARGKALAEKYIDLAISEEVLSVLAPGGFHRSEQPEREAGRRPDQELAIWRALQGVDRTRLGHTRPGAGSSGWIAEP
jgi:spermidine/putrescine-binding protein